MFLQARTVKKIVCKLLGAIATKNFEYWVCCTLSASVRWVKTNPKDWDGSQKYFFLTESSMKTCVVGTRT
jgi:hypothetical protein